MTAPQTYSDSRPAGSRSGICLGMSVVGALGCIALGLTSPAAFWSGYLVAAIFWMSISAGSLAIALIHGVSGGRWGRALGRALHAGISTLLFSIAACWVLALGAGFVFPWASTSGFETLNPHQQMWLVPWAVVARFVVISLLWLVLGFWLNGRYRLDAGDLNREVPQGRAALGLILYFISYSIVAIDFMMALTPTWTSSMYPLIRILNCGVAALALCTIAYNSRLLHPTRDQLDRVHDLGNLLQAFNLLWTYLSFSQYILVWTGDIAIEVAWYMERRTPFWMVISVVLFALHFVIPFLLLLSRGVKRTPEQLTRVAGLLLGMCLVDIAWTILPSIPVPTTPALLSALSGTAAIGGIWLFLFRRSYAVLPDMVMGSDHDPAAHHAVEQAAGESA